jgi:hypothetical protein
MVSRTGVAMLTKSPILATVSRRRKAADAAGALRAPASSAQRRVKRG